MAAVSPRMTNRARLALMCAFACGAGLQPCRAARPIARNAAGVQARAGVAPAPHDSPRRIVSMVPSTTEMLFEIGGGDRVVGVSNYDHFPPAVEKIPRVGGLIDPNVERLLSLRPDLVIVYDTQVELKRQIEHAGIPIYPYRHRNLADITQTLRSLGARVGLKEAADAAAQQIGQRLTAIGKRVAGLPRPKTLLVIGRDRGPLRNVIASGGYGFLHDVLEIAGGADVLADVQRQSVIMSTEMILTRAPEVIIDLHYGASIPFENLEAERRAWNAVPSVPAVKSGRVYLLVGDEFVAPGPRIVIAADRFARTLHPEAFK
jgi:iron complex transport system substrate-binding protein